VEHFPPQNIWSLHGRTFVLNSTIGLRVTAFSDRRFHVLVLLGSILAFGVRGAKYNPIVSGDDATLVSHALDRQMPWGMFGHFDKLGLFDPFNDYLAVLLRIVTHVALIGPDTGFAFRIYVIMTIFWALVTWVIALTIKNYVSPMAGVTTALTLCWLPFSNQVFLAQANTIAWPLALLCILVVALRIYPEKQLYRVVLVVVFSLTAMSTGTMIVAIGWLVFDIARNIRTINRFQFVLLFFTSISYYIQWIAYKPRPNVKLPLGHELYRTLFSWSPQFIRNRIGQELSSGVTLILWLIPILLITSWLFLFVSAYTFDRLRAVASLRLMITSLVLPVLLITGNGWLNTHYLFIPSALFWLSALILAASIQVRKTPVSQLAIGVLVFFYCTAISGVYYVL
jgi:hypothetical protein